MDDSAGAGPAPSWRRASSRAPRSQWPHTPNTSAGSGTRSAFLQPHALPERGRAYKPPTVLECRHPAAGQTAALRSRSPLSLRTTRHAGKDTRNLALKPGKLHIQHHPSRMQDHIHARRQLAQMQAHRFSHTPADAVPFHCTAQHTPRRQSHSRLRACRILGRSCAKEIAHRSQRIPSALPIHALVVRVFSQTGAAPVEFRLRHISILSRSWEGRPATSAASLNETEKDKANRDDPR